MIPGKDSNNASFFNFHKYCSTIAYNPATQSTANGPSPFKTVSLEANLTIRVLIFVIQICHITVRSRTTHTGKSKPILRKKYWS